MNMQAMLQQAQRMQKDIQTKQAEIEKSEFTGTSEMVDITIYGSKKVKSVNIKVKSLDEDDVEVLEDMIKIAMNDAISKVEKETEAKLGSYGKQLGGLI
ncbi:MAG: YbaB/EbfC family nucleoid-associated protein [Bacilli bacterium]|nr:YbaB/EbfC family nucleoid-associated protein [Bacilli bacterium]